MKGMQKIKRGSGFRGLLDYAMEGGRGRIVGGNMSSGTVRELAAEFGATRAIRPDIEKPVWHNSLRLPTNDHLTDDQWDRIADEYMRHMGFTDVHPRTYILHDDVDGQHIHLVACRVGLDGSVYLGRQENLISTQVIQDLEVEYGLTITKGPSPTDGTIRKPKKNEIEKSIRTGDASPRLVLQQLVGAAAKGKPDIFEFIDRLQVAGVSVIPNVASTGMMNGFSFAYENSSFKGSNLGKDYTWKELKKQVIYEQARDGEKLIAIAGAGAARIGTHQNDSGISANSGNAGSGFDDSHRRNEGENPGIGAAESGDRQCIIESVETGDKVRAIPVAGTDHKHHHEMVADLDSGGNIDPDIDDLRLAVQSVSSHASAIEASRPGFGGRQSVNVGNGTTAKKPAHIRAKEIALTKQNGALKPDKYRVTLKPRFEKDSFGKRLYEQNYGNRGNKKEREAAGIQEKFWSFQDLKNEIPNLSSLNARGYDIYITPMSDSEHYILVDDITSDKYMQC